MHATCVRCGAKEVYELRRGEPRTKHYVTPEGAVVKRRPECGPKEKAR